MFTLCGALLHGSKRERSLNPCAAVIRVHIQFAFKFQSQGSMLFIAEGGVVLKIKDNAKQPLLSYIDARGCTW